MDRAELEALFRSHGVLVERVAYRVVANREAARDIAQDVWLRLLVSGVEPRDRAATVSWLQTVAKNAAVDHVRREARSGEISELGEIDDGRHEGTREGAEASGLLKALKEAISRLSIRQREVFEARLILGLSVRETAEALGVAEGTVKATLSQARAALRETLVD